MLEALSRGGRPRPRFLGNVGFLAAQVLFVFLPMHLCVDLHLEVKGMVDVVSNRSAPTIRFGTPVAFHTEKGIAMIRAYHLFFDYLNEVHGGITLDGKKVMAELVLVDDKNSKSLVEGVTRYIVNDRNIKLVLAPYGSGLTGLAAQVVQDNGAVMVAGASSVSSVFAGKSRVFGTLASSASALDPVFEVLAAQVAVHAGRQLPLQEPKPTVAYFRENANFPKAVCGQVPTLSTKYDMTFLGDDASSIVLSLADIPAMVTKLKQDSVDIVIGCVYDSFCRAFVWEARAQDFNPKAIVSTICVTSSTFFSGLGDTARFVLGVAPWTERLYLRSALFKKRIGKYMFNTSHFVKRFQAAYAETPIYQAASAWSACAVMVAAIEKANSTVPAAVAAEIQSGTFETVFGKIDFNADGQSLNAWKAVQFQGDGEIEHLVSGNESERVFFYPMPAWGVRNCYHEMPRDSVFGMTADGSCASCPDQQRATFNMINQTRFCEDCPPGRSATTHHDCRANGSFASCPPGRFAEVRRNCVLDCQVGSVPVNDACSECAPGTYQTGALCQSCGWGFFGSGKGKTECTLCYAGSMTNSSGSSACGPCPPGTSSADRGSIECLPCQAGKTTQKAGSLQCKLCNGGTVATDQGLSVCSTCTAGKVSAWGSTRCVNCSVGTYQDLPSKTKCKSAPTGTVCRNEGMSQCINKQGYWIGSVENQSVVELCRNTPESCLNNEGCLPGHTGRQCLACVPGYARSGSLCFECPHVLQNVLATVAMFWCSVFYILGVSVLVTRACGRPQDVHAIMGKQLLTHIITLYVCVEVLMTVLKEHRMNVCTDGLSTCMVDWGLMISLAVSGIGDGTILSESPMWSVSCLVQSTFQAKAHPGAWQDVNHSHFAHPTMAASVQKLADSAWYTEVGVAIFWSFWPFALYLAANLVGAVLLIQKLRKYETWYEDAWKFYMEVFSQGFQFTAKKVPSNKWMPYVQDYPNKVLSMWWPVRHLRNYFHHSRSGINVISWPHFFAESRVTFLCAFFCTYCTALRGALRPLHCDRLRDNEVAIMFTASTLQCYATDDALFWFSFAACVLLGLVIPIQMFWKVFKVRDRLLEEDVQAQWGFLTNGYKQNRWWWEAVIFARKGFLLMVTILSLSAEARVLMLLLSCVVTGVIQICFQPYDNRANGLLHKVEWGHLTVFMLTAVAIKIVEVATAEPGRAGSKIIVALVPALVAMIHMGYTVVLVFMMFVKIRAAHFQDIDDSQIAKMREGVIKRMCQRLAYTQRQLSKAAPYISLDPHYGWISIVGSRGDLATPPYFPKARDAAGLPGFRPLFSSVPDIPFEHNDGDEAPTRHPSQVLEGNKTDNKVCYASVFNQVGVMEILLGAMMKLAPTHKMFSTNLFEFIVRAAFVIRRQNRGRTFTDLGAEEVDQCTWEVAKRKRDPLALLGDGRRDQEEQAKKEAEGDVELHGTAARTDSRDHKKNHKKKMPDKSNKASAGEVVDDTQRAALVQAELIEEDMKVTHRDLFESKSASPPSNDEKPGAAIDLEADASEKALDAVDEASRAIADAKQEQALVEHRLKLRVEDMLMPHTFRQGMTITEFQFSVMRLLRMSESDLGLWMNLFDQQCIHRRAQTMRALMRGAGASVETGEQISSGAGHETVSKASFGVDAGGKKGGAEFSGVSLDDFMLKFSGGAELPTRGTQTGCAVHAWCRFVLGLGRGPSTGLRPVTLAELRAPEERSSRRRAHLALEEQLATQRQEERSAREARGALEGELAALQRELFLRVQGNLSI